MRPSGKAERRTGTEDVTADRRTGRRGSSSYTCHLREMQHLENDGGTAAADAASKDVAAVARKLKHDGKSTAKSEGSPWIWGRNGREEEEERGTGPSPLRTARSPKFE